MSTRKKFYLAKSNQEGGTIENDLKEFSKYLMELIGATTDEELKNFVKEQGPEKVNEIYKQWKEQVPMAKDGMQFVNKLAVESQKALIPGNIAIRNKIQDTGQDDLRGISSFKEAFAEARSRGLKQFSWGKGVYTTELTQPTNKSTDKQITKKSTEEKSATPTNKKKESVNTVVEKKGEDTNREVPDSLKRRDTPTSAQTVSSRKTTPTPLQPKDWGGLDDPMEWLKATGIVGAGAGIVGTGLYYGSNKYDQYKAAKLRAASAAPTAAPTAELSAPVRTPRVKVRAGSMARTTLTAPPAAPPPSGSTFKWEGWKYDTAPKSEGTTPKPGVKPEGTTLKPKATAPKPKGTTPKSGNSLKPSRATTLAGKLKMAGRANMLGMALGLISDLFPSKEAEELDRDAWEVSKNWGIRREEVTRNDVERYRKLIEGLKKGGKVNKLDYINKLNGECPEGYTTVKFAKGGVICTTCQKNKEVAAKKKNHLDAIKEEMKCGGKMKSHQKGGEMTNSQYKKAPLSKKVDQDLRDQAAGKNAGEGGTPKTDSTKVAPKKLIKKPTKK